MLVRFGSMGRLGLVASVAAVGGVLLLACNAIIGVEDVRVKPGVVFRDASSSSGGGDDDDDDASGSKDSGPTGPTTPMLAVGGSHACARMLDGTVRCWGENRLGQLGDGANLDAGTSPPDSPQPKVVPGVDDALSISAGSNHTCIVRAGGRLSCWGYNYSGQLGTGNNRPSSTPLDVPGLGEVAFVSAGYIATCAVLKDGTISCWGDNDNGQLGDGTKKTTSSPVKVKDLSGVVAVSMGTLHACAIVEPGNVFCWGDNAKGQLGNGSTAPSLVPQQVGGLSDAVEVVTGASFTCARERSGRVVCWGNNLAGQLGNGVAGNNANPSPILVASLTDATSIGAGLQHTCAVRASGEVVCWGEGDYGQLGSGRDAGTAVIDPVVGIRDARGVWGGGFTSCAIRETGKASCWGANTNGELGDGTTARAYVPVSVLNFP